jgi:hypothetical protein
MKVLYLLYHMFMLGAKQVMTEKIKPPVSRVENSLPGATSLENREPYKNFNRALSCSELQRTLSTLINFILRKCQQMDPPLMVFLCSKKHF